MIQREVADRLATALLEGEIVDGATVVVDATPDGLSLGEPADGPVVMPDPRPDSTHPKGHRYAA